MTGLPEGRLIVGRTVPEPNAMGRNILGLPIMKLRVSALMKECWNYGGERFAADIDPSFPEPIDEKELQTAIYLGSSEEHTSDWIEGSGLPDMDDLTKIHALDDISGPWILLNGWISEESKQMDRNFYFSCRAFLIDRNFSGKLMSYWGNADQEKVALPELIQTEYLYSGELNRLSVGSLDSDVEFEFVVGKKTEKQERRVFIGKNGIPVLMDKGKLVDVEVPIIEQMNVCSPVGEFFWSAGDTAMQSVRTRVLTSRLLEVLCLAIDPVSLDITDIQGNLAARNISFKGLEKGNYRDLFYMREDLLVKFMTEEELDLVWCVKGERRIARFEHVHTPDIRYKEFRFCKPMEIN